MKKPAQLLIALFALLSLTVALPVGAQRADDATSAAKYLSDREPQLKTIEKPNKRLFLLLYIAPAALAAGENEKARTYSSELIALGVSQRSQAGFGASMYSDSSHIGNLVLGQLALMDGDVEKAKVSLLAAGDVPGSSVLNSFGPNMLLAKELLKRGERETVVQYLDACGRFWKRQDEKLEQWKKIIAHGGMPDFGPNLTTGLANWRFDKRAI